MPYFQKEGKGDQHNSAWIYIIQLKYSGHGPKLHPLFAVWMLQVPNGSSLRVANFLSPFYYVARF